VLVIFFCDIKTTTLGAYACFGGEGTKVF